MSQAAYETGTVPPETTGWRLQRALSFADVSVEQMSAELGVSRSTVSRWLNDRGTPSLGYLKIWALRTGTPYSWIAHGIEPTSPDDDGPVSARSPGIPAGLSGQQPNGGYETVENDITRLRKRIPLRPAQQLAIVSAVAA